MKHHKKIKINSLTQILPEVSPKIFISGAEEESSKILERNVENFCHVCLKSISSNLLEINGKVYLEKNCCERKLIHLENDPDFFKKHKNNTQINLPISKPKNYQEAIGKKPNYAISGVQLYITTKCNMDCPICYLKFNNYLNRGIEMSIEEVKEKIKKYDSQNICVTGGEPTLRKDLFEIIKTIKNSGNVPGIITNGLKLVDENYVKQLKKSGLNFIALQFDGFNKAANKVLRGEDFLEEKLKALENIKKVGGLRVQLVSVVDRETNAGEMSNIIHFALENEFIRKINFVGLTPPRNENKTATCLSDMIKVMEKEGYFNREYFLELVKMYRSIYEVIRKIFEGTSLESWIFKKLPGNFNVVHFKKGTNSPELLFKRKEIKKINKILIEALNQRSKIATTLSLLKNSKNLIKSPLFILIKEKFPISKKVSSPNKLLEVSFHKLGSPENTLFELPRGVISEFPKILPAIAMIYPL